MNIIVLISLLLTSIVIAAQGNSAMKIVKAGRFVPLYGSDSTAVYVRDFMMDVYPVSQQKNLEFVAKYSKWRRSNVLALFADKNYLRKNIRYTSLSMPNGL